MNRSQQLTEQYASQNRESAVIILADVARYSGEETALVIWARAVLGPKDNENGPLFRRANRDRSQCGVENARTLK
jgi:hypothetical protein